MAVPRTHDGSVGPNSTSSAVLPILSAVFAVVVVACLVVLGLRYQDASGSFGDRLGEVFGGGGDDAVAAPTSADDPRTRELVLSQANQFMIRINTYGPSDLDKSLKMPGYVTGVDEVITPKFAVEFEKSVTYAEQSVSQAGLQRSVQLYATGAESIQSDLATVLVTGVISQSYPDPDPDKDTGRIEFEPLQFRYEVRLVNTGGTWLVDDFSPVRGEVEGEPTNGATDPSAPTTGAPTGGAGSTVVERYAEIVANRQADLTVVVNALSGCGFPQVAKAGDPTCVEAPSAVGAAAKVLANSLQGAANPSARVYVGVPPAKIAGLVTSTTTAAQGVVSATSALRPACVVTDSSACQARRTAVVAAVNRLSSALRGWGALS